MRNSIAPGITIMPSRAVSSPTTPPMGAKSVIRGRVLPSVSMAATVVSDMPSRISRWRAAWRNASLLCGLFFSARYSSCAATHSGASISASGWPLATVSSGARTNNFSMKPLTRACTTATARSSNATAPTTCTFLSSEPCVTSAVRMPRFCTTRELIFTEPPSLPGPPSSPKTGTSIMSMKGDLPGLSNFCCGYIGS